jgi:hypothetical protein
MAGGGAGGAGGQGGVAPINLFDFEDGVQGWGGGTATWSSEQYSDGAYSLKLTYGALDNANALWSRNGDNRNGVEFWPGTVITVRAWLPIGWDTSGGSYFQVIGQGNNYALFDSTGNSARTAMPGAWTTWTYTIPETFPGGFQALAFQLGDNSGGATIPAGSVYIDQFTAVQGTANCARATPTAMHDFETEPLNAMYQKDGTDADTVASQSIDYANGGTHSWKVAFTALPAPPATMQTTRRVFINAPNVYCGQTVTVRVRLPAGSTGMTFQIFAQYNNYAKFGASATPGTITPDGWTSLTYTVPATGADAVGPGGIQRLGVQFIWTGTTAFTGNAYIDDITW